MATRDSMRDPLDTLRLDPETLAELRHRSEEDLPDPRTQLDTIPFELHHVAERSEDPEMDERRSMPFSLSQRGAAPLPLSERAAAPFPLEPPSAPIPLKRSLPPPERRHVGRWVAVGVTLLVALAVVVGVWVRGDVVVPFLK